MALIKKQSLLIFASVSIDYFKDVFLGEQMKKRIVELNISKAISIAIVVFSHLTFSEQFQRNFVSLFDVPVFFILSGFF